MSPPPISLIEDLTTNDIEKLTKLLVLAPLSAPHPVWLQEQADFIRTLPLKLKRPESILPRLAMSIPFGTQKADLCPSHKPLNPYLIRRIFLQVSAECTTRLNRLVENRYLPADTAIHVKALQTANSLWMSPELYRVTFQCQPQEERYERIASDCDACILAAVGGNIRILRELRTSMLGRRTKRGKTPRLLPLVEAWIEWTGAEDALRAKSDALAKEVRSCRRQMQDARRQKRRNIAEGIIEGATPAYDDNDINVSLLDHDAAAQAFDHQEYDESPHHHHEREHDEHDNDPEGSIIDYYANRLSSAKQTLSNAQTESSIHPAFRNSVFQFQTNTSSSTLHAHLPPRSGNPTAYTETEPSLNDVHRGASAAAVPPGTRTHQPPPLAYHNRANQKHMQKQAQVLKKRETGYTESVYSSGGAYGNGSYIPSRLQNSRVNLQNIQDPQQQHKEEQKSRRTKSTEEQAGEYRGLLNVQDHEDSPRRNEWEDLDGDGDVEGDGRRDTRVTSFGDFI